MLPVIECARRRSASGRRRARSRAPTRHPDRRSNVPISPTPGWGKDYADPSTFFAPVRRPHDHPRGQHELLARRPHAGAGADLKVQGHRRRRPERRRGYRRVRDRSTRRASDLLAGLDRKLMEQIVPWVPYLVANVTRHQQERHKYEFDQSRGEPAWSHIAVDSRSRLAGKHQHDAGGPPRAALRIYESPDRRQIGHGLHRHDGSSGRCSSSSSSCCSPSSSSSRCRPATRRSGSPGKSPTPETRR